MQSVPRASLHRSARLMHSHSAHLSWQCWQNSLFLSCRLAETDPLRGNTYQLVPTSLPWGCTKSRTLLLTHCYLWQDPHLHLMELCFTTAVKNQQVPPMLPGCSSAILGAGAATEQPLAIRVKTTPAYPLAVAACAKQS